MEPHIITLTTSTSINYNLRDCVFGCRVVLYADLNDNGKFAVNKNNIIIPVYQSCLQCVEHFDPKRGNYIFIYLFYYFMSYTSLLVFNIYYFHYRHL